MPVNITTRRAKTGDRFVVRYRLGGRAAPLMWGGSFATREEAELRRDHLRRLIAAGVDPMTETDAHALLKTVLCSHPGCKDDAETGRSTCRFHRADRRGTRRAPAASVAEMVERAVVEGRLCKVSDCAQPPVAARGPYAGLCQEHADVKREAHSARVTAGMGAANIGHQQPARTPLGIVKELQQAARDLEKAQTRYDEAKAGLNRAKRAWKTALQDAAVAS